MKNETETTVKTYTHLSDAVWLKDKFESPGSLSLTAVVCHVVSGCTYSSGLIFLYSHGEDIEWIHRAPNNLKVVLEDGDRARERLMSTATEQGHTRVQQDGCNKRWIWYPTQAFDAAVKASWRQHKGFQAIIMFKSK